MRGTAKSFLAARGLGRDLRRKGAISSGLFALVLALLFATAAGASSGIVSYFSLPPTPHGIGEQTPPDDADPAGIIVRAAGAAVNANGNGSASPGDVYIADQGGGTYVHFGPRISQFSALDDFVRLWGPDVVKEGPDNSNEVQAVRVASAAGSFKLSFGAGTTPDLPANASAAQVASALNGLGSIGAGGVSVTGGPGDAGGSSPYLISFDGGALAGADQPLLLAADGATPLSGGAATVTVYTTNPGATGFEHCVPANGDVCKTGSVNNPVYGGGFGQPGGMALDQASGDLYLVDGDLGRITQFSPDGEFIRAWGWDVVAAGPDDSNADEQQEVTVEADGGTFKLNFGNRTTAAIPYNASATQVGNALDALSNIGGNQSSVTVTGGPGDLAGSSPYLIVFHGLLGGDDLDQLSANGSLLTASAGTPSATASTFAEGGGFEVCGPEDACKEASRFILGASKPGAFGIYVKGIAVAPAGSPNAGNILVGDGGSNRVEEFTADGEFVRTFGWDVDATNPSTGFEVCTAASGDTCQAGASGSGLGQFATPNGATLRAVTEDSSGAIYTVEGTGASSSGVGRRVQKFTPAGGQSLTPSIFGSNEVQALTVNASAGQFRLGAFEAGGTTGTGTVAVGSSTITGVSIKTGAFLVGQPIDLDTSFPYGTYITAVGLGTLSVSQPATHTPNGEATALSLVSNRLFTTPDLPFNAVAAQIESAINALQPIVGSGSVTVSGGPGGPYQVNFDGGHLARTDPPQLIGSQGTTPLSGGSGPGANTASAVTTIPGGPGAANVPGETTGADSPRGIAIGPGGNVVVSRNYASGDPCPDGNFPPAELRVQELDSSGSVIGTSDPCGGIRPQVLGAGNNDVPSSLSVNSLTGRPYLLDNGSPDGGGSRLVAFGSPGAPPVLTLDQSLSNVSSTGATISGTIDPNGPGTSYPDTTGTPSSYRTTYRVEYKEPADSDWTRFSPDTPIGSGTSALPFSVGVGGLDPKTSYDLRVVVTKPLVPGGVVEDQKSFTTDGAPPLISAFRSSGVTASSADLHALINPQGTDTTYHFDYGTTTNYDNSTPEADIGESGDPQPVQAHISGLSDTTYHFRVVATNSLGTTTSEDQTFVFHPPTCPNQTVRQQTNAAYLPDCRAYELVSPENAGGTTLYTGGPQRPYATGPSRLAFVGQFGEIPGAGATPINNGGDLYLATRGSSGWTTKYIGLPSSEAGCMGGRPAMSPFGWPTTFQNDVMASPDLGRLIDWSLGNPMECTRQLQGNQSFGDFNTAAQGSNSPYVWSASGARLGRWPTGLDSTPGAAANFACPQDPDLHPYPSGYLENIPVSYFCSTNVTASGDLNHFVFSTQSGLFGQGGIGQAPGSAYDNDTVDGTLTLVSKTPGGAPIGQYPGSRTGPGELIQFPHVSTDGSRILMGTAVNPQCRQLTFYPPICPLISQPTHLYMRVNDAVTYDVSADHNGVGRAVTYVDSTPDGTKVYFTTKLQMTADDTDTSTDLYMWDEGNGVPTLTRLSAGAPDPAGNTDNCISTWTTNCDVKVYDSSSISTVAANKGGLGGWTYNEDNQNPIPNPNPGYTDNSVAAKAGDIYFYSPEQLVPGKGVPGRQNVYAYHDGSVRFVAALSDDLYCIDFGALGIHTGGCSDGPLGRLQVTPDGRYAAFITTSKITAYDNAGHAEMYRYDANSGVVRCMSCNPDGSPPSSDALGSMGGRFITDDGRVFFDTEEALDPRDSNGAKDTYEFVDGRPQLIGTGTGEAGAGAIFTAESVPGLYGVSADGTDVYFGTFETLVGQDRNGSGQLKFYDARTNGGFPFVPPPPSCAAADECHGPSSGVPGALANGTGANLGAGGNFKEAAKQHKKQKHKHKKKRRKHKNNKHRKAGRGR